VPALLIDGTMMSESLPICEYIDEAFPYQGIRLIPEIEHNNIKASMIKRYQVRRLCEVINSNTQPLIVGSVTKRVQKFGGDPKQWSIEVTEKGMNTFE
jgi:glutathione S-transferase